MLSLISFILVSIGCINWFTIGILQFDFVAGIFGSQSNIFSRLIYTLVGIAAIVMIINFATNKGKFIVSFKKADKEFDEYKEMKEEKRASHKRAMATESSDDLSLSDKIKKNNYNTEADDDMSHTDSEDNCGKTGNCNKSNSKKD